MVQQRGGLHQTPPSLQDLQGERRAGLKVARCKVMTLVATPIGSYCDVIMLPKISSGLGFSI